MKRKYPIAKKALISSDEECMPKPKYYIENGLFSSNSGLRKVEPYYFKYKTFVKERWLDKTIIQVFEQEFRDKPKSYYVSTT